MAAFPTIFANSVTVTTNNNALSYKELTATLSYTTYPIDSIYLYSPDGGTNQVSEPLTLTTSQPTGQQSVLQYTPTVDPNQFQSSVFYNPDDNFILSQLTTVGFNIAANTTLQMDFFYSKSASYSYLLPGDNNDGSSIVITTNQDNTQDTQDVIPQNTADNGGGSNNNQIQECDCCDDCNKILLTTMIFLSGLLLIKILTDGTNSK